MSDNYMNLFPADPLRPKPDWPSLRSALLERGFMRDPKLRYPDYGVAHHLWERILEDRGRADERVPNRLHKLDSVVECLRNIELVPSSFTLDCSGLTVPEFIAALQRHGYLSPGFTFPAQEEFAPGPLYWELCSMKEPPSDAARWGIEIYFEDFGERMSVACGQGFFGPPGIPGTDRVCAEWGELMDRWCRDPSQKWIDPETGKGYGVLDLDWDNTLGAGRCWLEIHSPAYLDGNRAVALLTELTGQEFRYSWRHI
jgi:hypothetical protein